LRELLQGIDLAVVFTPRERPPFLSRLAEGGVRRVVWAPSFPDGGEEPVDLFQARHLGRLGLSYTPQPLSLQLDQAAQDEAQRLLSGPGPWLAVAPGSGHAAKNWPLSHYFEVTRALAWELKMSAVWLAGPAEHPMLPYLAGLAAAEGQVLAASFPLPTVAAILSRSLLYLGGDSGLTHLAAAAGTKRILALFGPTSPHVWAPRGGHVRVLTAPGPCAPCADSRDIACPRPDCLASLSPHLVFQTARGILKSG
jgi:ADP-heptose:LPS heptosyltransferase